MTGGGSAGGGPDGAMATEGAAVGADGTATQGPAVLVGADGTATATGRARVSFCGEHHDVEPGDAVVIGREGDVCVDDNPYLHRRFLRVEHSAGLWWLANVGGQLSATVSDAAGAAQTWLAPGARIPLVFAATVVRFTAGPTTYELTVDVDHPTFAVTVDDRTDSGETTIGPTALTPDQKLLIVALAEPFLRGDGRGSGAVPSSADAARRLGWTITKFNRKLDNVCQKLTKVGVQGLHGEAGALASNRRARLVEYALAARLVHRDDLALLGEA